MNSSQTSNVILGGTVLVAVLMFISLLAGSGVQVLRDFNPFGFIGSIFQPRAEVGGLQVNLLSGEEGKVITLAEADVQLAQHGLLGTSFEELLPGASTCLAVSGTEVQGMIVCAPADAPPPGTAAAEGSFEVMVTPLTERADALMRNPNVAAVTVARFDESLAEHRSLLIQQGSAVLDFVTEYSLTGITFAGLTLDRSEGSEWLGYADVGGVRHVAWAWAPDEQALTTLLTR